MKDEPVIFTLPPNCSDKSAYELSEFFYNIGMALENHYATQIRRYWKKKKLEFKFCERCHQYGNESIEVDLTEEVPF